MTSLDKDGFTVEALGKQAQSSRLTAPVYTLSKVSRDHRAHKFISKEHVRMEQIGRHSAPADYNLPSTLNKKGVSFPKGPCTDMLKEPKNDGALNSNEELAIHVDSQPFKYPRDSTILIGTDPRGKMKDAALLKNHSAAFFGRQSPGPAAIGGDYGPNYLPTKERMAPARPFGMKVKTDLWSCGDTPANMGPGVYPRNDTAIGQQYLTKRRNQSVHAFPHAAKFPKGVNADTISTLDAARSSLGKQSLGKNRSEPTIGFTMGSRDSRSRTAPCLTPMDEGPKAFMPKMNFSMPNLPKENHIMTSGFG